MGVQGYSASGRHYLSLENLEDLSVEEVMEQFDVTREQINAVLDFVAQSLKTPEPAALTFENARSR